MPIDQNLYEIKWVLDLHKDRLKYVSIGIDMSAWEAFAFKHFFRFKHIGLRYCLDCTHPILNES